MTTDEQGRGLGTFAVENVIGQARAHDAATITGALVQEYLEDHGDRLVAFWKKMGFEVKRSQNDRTSLLIELSLEKL